MSWLIKCPNLKLLCCAVSDEIGEHRKVQPQSESCMDAVTAGVVYGFYRDIT